MATLPVRLVLFVVLPAVLGGMAAWATRPTTVMPGSSLSAGKTGKPEAPAVARGAGKPGRVGSPLLDEALAEQRRYCERLRTADSAQMMEMLEETGAMDDSIGRDLLESLIYGQMARTDPVAAMALLVAAGKSGSPLLQAWAAVDAAAALTWAEGCGADSESMIQAMVFSLVPDDVDAFVKILPRLKPASMPDSKISSAFGLLGSRNADEARQLLEVLTNRDQQNNASYSLAEGWARRDAPAAYAWAKALTDPVQRESALRGVFRAWAETDPKGTAARLDDLTKDPAMAKSAAGDSPIRAVVRAWAAQDPKAAAAWLRTRPQENQSVSFHELLTSEILPSRDEWKATEIADLIRRPGNKVVTEDADRNSPFNQNTSWGSSEDDDSHYVIGQYGGPDSPLRETSDHFQRETYVRIADPALAFDELARQPGDATRQHVLQEVASQWVEKDPAAAMAKLRQTTDPWLKLGLINALSDQARRTLDPQLAEEIARTYPETAAGHGTLAIMGIYNSLAERDPAKAEVLLQGDLDTGIKASIASRLASRQATYDPAGAVEWAAGQGDERVRQDATWAAVHSWAGADAFAASEWLAGQAAGPAREAAVVGLVDALKQSSPHDALQWAASLTDPLQRESTQMNIVQNLVRNDLARARELAAGLTLSEANRKQLDSYIESAQKSGN